MSDSQTRHNRGLYVVVFLGVLFFVLLGLLLFNASREDDKAPPAPHETLVVLPIRIRIRTAPQATAPVVATATTGEQLVMLEDRGAWVRVQTNDGLAGWAERANLERATERQRRLTRYENIRKLPPIAGLAGESTPLYAGSGIFYPLVGELESGSKVTVYTRDHDFYAIEYKGQIAYADVDAIELSATGSKRVDVASAPPASTETAAPPGTESAPPVEEPPPAEPPAAEPEPSLARGGVYPSVPPGGTDPEELRRVMPVYPPMARRANVSGPVVLRGIVRRDGSIDEVEILKDLPYGLGSAARDAVRQWRFRPATYRGEPIDVYYMVTVNFRLQ